MTVTIIGLWLPILLATILVFVASSLLWTVIPWHDRDWKGLPGADDVQRTMRQHGVGAGQYMIPYCPDPKGLQEPEMQQRFNEGPVGYFYVQPPGIPKMGGRILRHFVFQLAVMICVAYLASRTMGAGEDYLLVFRVTSTITFLAFGAGTVQDHIWFAHSRSQTVKNLIDALVFGLLTGGIFGWLWP